MIKEFIEKEDAAHMQYWLIKDHQRMQVTRKTENNSFKQDLCSFFVLYVGNRWKLYVKDIQTETTTSRYHILPLYNQIVVTIT